MISEKTGEQKKEKFLLITKQTKKIQNAHFVAIKYYHHKKQT